MSFKNLYFFLKKVNTEVRKRKMISCLEFALKYFRKEKNIQEVGLDEASRVKNLVIAAPVISTQGSAYSLCF